LLKPPKRKIFKVNKPFHMKEL